MSNELRDIVNRLSGYSDTFGWEVTNAQKNEDGTWTLKVKEIENEEEAVNDEN